MKKSDKKLALHKDTIRQLAVRELASLHGGANLSAGVQPKEHVPFPTAKTCV